jgi:hypothetical protein
VWALCPLPGRWLASPAMLDPAWPVERLRGGILGLWPGGPDELGVETVAVLLGGGGTGGPVSGRPTTS